MKNCFGSVGRFHNLNPLHCRKLETCISGVPSVLHMQGSSQATDTDCIPGFCICTVHLFDNLFTCITYHIELIWLVSFGCLDFNEVSRHWGQQDVMHEREIWSSSSDSRDQYLKRQCDIYFVIKNEKNKKNNNKKKKNNKKHLTRLEKMLRTCLDNRSQQSHAPKVNIMRDKNHWFQYCCVGQNEVNAVYIAAVYD